MKASTSAAVNTYTDICVPGKKVTKSDIFDIFWKQRKKHTDDEKSQRGTETMQLRLLATVCMSERPHYNVKEVWEKHPGNEHISKGVVEIKKNLVDDHFKRQNNSGGF